MDKKINIAIIGLGYWGPNLLRNFSSLSRCDVFYCCDSNQDALDKFLSQYPSTKFTTNYDAILNDRNVRAVAIATPVFTHFELAKKALLAGKHVFLEKPMASSVKECEELVKLAEERDLVLMIDHTFLFTGAIKKIKKLITNGELGDLHYFDSERINLGLLQKDINVIWDLASHDVSIINYLFEELRPVSVMATGGSYINKKFEEIAHIHIDFASGAIGAIHVSWLSPVKIRKILIGGSKKMIIYNDIEPSEKVKIYDKGVSINLEEETSQKPIYRSGDVYIPKIEETEALRSETEHFINCILDDENPLVDGHAGIKVVRILEASDQSLRTGQKIIL